MEANEDKRMTIIDATPVRDGIYRASTWAILLFGGSAVALIGIGIWTVRSYLIYVGYAALIAAFIILACGVAIPIIFVLRYALKTDTTHIGEFGTMMRSLFGKTTIYAPMAPANVRLAREKKTAKITIIPDVPSIAQMLGNEIKIDQIDLAIGYEQANNQLIPQRIEWPGTAIIAGSSGTGKTRRTILMLFQALLGRAIVTILDPHGAVDGSLIKTISPLAPWIAQKIIDEQSMIVAARSFIDEMLHRLHDDSNEKINGEWIPRLLIFDEWPALMKSEQLEKEEKEILMRAVRDAGTQFRKVKGYCWIIGQEFTQDGIGDTAIRKGAHAIFCHQIHEEYAKFLFASDRKAQRLAATIERKECIYKDQDRHIRRVITPKIPDVEINELAEYLMECIPMRLADKTIDIKKQIAPPQARRITEQLAVYSHSPQIEQEDELGNIIDGKGVNAREEPVEPLDEGKGFTVDGEGFTADVKALYTPSEETQVVLAAQQIAQENGGKVTRQAIRDRLGWNVRKHSVVKAVCDKHGIARI